MSLSRVVDQQPILVASCHSVSGSAKSHHDIPGKTPEARVRFKQNCLILTLRELHAAALAPQQGKSVQYIMAGDFNLTNPDFQDVMQGWGQDLHWIAAKNRDYIASNVRVRDVVEDESDLPIAHDGVHYTIACETYIEEDDKEAEDVGANQKACYHTPNLIHPTIQLPQAAQAALAILQQPGASASTRGERMAELQDQSDRAINELVCREAEARARNLASRLQHYFR